MKNRKTATLTHQLLIGCDRRMFDALEHAASMAYPPKSQSELCREAIYLMLAHNYPQALQIKSDKSEKIIPAE